MIGPWIVDRTVIRSSGAPATLMTSSRVETDSQVPVPQVGVTDHPFEVEVGDVRAEVGEAPRDVAVVADDDSRDAGEGEAR